ncbi:MAG: response regulator [Candidatus Omnitrophica bacterium]|nr:response regulator [Candidatus Omnitrophota bacterium]
MTQPIVLIAENDDDQYELTLGALADLRTTNRLRRVVDGEELWKDGRQTLREIKAHPDLRRIPVVVLTISRDEEDVSRMYALGASSYITKPISYFDLEETMKTFKNYWLDVVRLPKSEGR